MRHATAVRDGKNPAVCGSLRTSLGSDSAVFLQLLFFQANEGFPDRARRPCYSLYSLHGWSHTHLLIQRVVLGLCCGSFQPENEQESQDRRPWPAGSNKEKKEKENREPEQRVDESRLAPFVDFFLSTISFSVSSVSLLTFPPRSNNSLAFPFVCKTSSLSSGLMHFSPFFIHNLFSPLPSVFPLQPSQRLFRPIPISSPTKTLLVSPAARSARSELSTAPLSTLHSALSSASAVSTVSLRSRHLHTDISMKLNHLAATKNLSNSLTYFHTLCVCARPPSFNHN